MRNNKVKDRQNYAYIFDILLFLTLSVGFSDNLSQNIVPTFYPINKVHLIKDVSYKIGSHLRVVAIEPCN